MLMELLWSISISSIVLVLLLNLLMVTTQGSNQQSYDAELNYYARVIQDSIQKEIRTAKSIQIVNNGQELKLTDAQGNITRFYCYRGNFYRYHQTSIPVAEYVEAINFSECGQGVYVQLQMQSPDASLDMGFTCFRRC